MTICPADQPLGMTWDSSGIVFGQGIKGILRCSPNGGMPEQLATVKANEFAHGPQMLPGGKTLLFSIANVADGDARWDKSQVVVQDLMSGARKTLFTGGSDARYLRTGHLLYALGGIVFAVPFDPARQTVVGGVVSVVEGVRLAAPSAGGSARGAAQFDTSGTGTLLFMPGPIGTTAAERAVAMADRAGALTRNSARLRSNAGPSFHVR